MENLADAKEGRGGLIVYFSPPTLRGMYEDLNRHVMKSDDYEDDFKRFIRNRMKELSEQYKQLTGFNL